MSEPVRLDPQAVLVALTARSRQHAAQSAEQTFHLVEEVARLEAYVAVLVARIAELEQPADQPADPAPADAWGDPAT